ncbi:MAG: exo-alpha-sialidase [Draconibacterium sp.]
MNKRIMNIILLMTLVLVSCSSSASSRYGGNDFMTIQTITTHSLVIPILKRNETNKVIRLEIVTKGKNKPLTLEQVWGKMSGNISELADLALYNETNDISVLVGTATNLSKKIRLNSEYILAEGNNTFWLSVKLTDTADIDGKLSINLSSVTVNGEKFSIQQETQSKPFSFGIALRKQNDDNVNTYRIPGLTTTNKGTLIAVYDVRYNNSKDLQEDIDIGMSRSTDGGQTWEPMQIIMDMGEWGGRPQKLNGIGDPCVLYDNETGTLWVAGLWMSGANEKDALWRASNPGMKPEETGQFILVKSPDDGLTWSAPINITEQIKDPAWQLLLQGPGRGICMKDGTLVFPAQFKANIAEKSLDGGEFTCHSTIVYSKDHGKSWHIGTGAKSNTTEAQVVELADGSLMLNMRDDRNKIDKGETNGRAVSVTSDFGKNWTVHPSSNTALPEPNCMASIISANVKVGKENKEVLFFSNPDNKNSRSNMTIKASLDGGLTWPAEYQLEIYETKGFGYSCMTMIDEQTIGILYEGTKELYFQRILVSDILD